MSQVHYIADSSCLKTLVFMAAVSLTLMAPSALAGEPLRLTVDGQISGLFDPIPGHPDGNAAFGLVNGDPFRFVFDFDSRFDENGSIAIERYEVQIDGQSLVAAGPLGLTEIRANFFDALTSRFAIDSSDIAAGEVNGIEAEFTFYTAVPLFLEVTVPTSVLAGPSDGFPADLEFSDVISTFAGTFILSNNLFGTDGENITSVFTFEVTDLGVAVVPEPGMAAISVLAFAACLQRRRRPWAQPPGG